MENAKISPGQLFALLVLFNLGTAILRVLAIDAEKDAWLAILLGAIGGLFLFYIYVSLYRQYPNLPLTGYMRAILGKWIGWPLGLIYVLFFIHGAARDLREGGDLLAASVLDQTPLIVLNIVMIFSIAYVLNKGFEVLARTAQIFFSIFLIFAAISGLLLYFSGVIDINRLLPVLAKGWGPVNETTLKQTFQFPHEEVICFAMVLPYLANRKKGIRAGYLAVIVSVLILAYSTAMNVAVLGVDISARAVFPLLHTISLINIGEFIQRLDVFVVLTLILGDFYKTAIFYYAVVIAAADVFQIQDHKKLVNYVGLIILFISMMLTGNFAEQIEEGNVLLDTFFLAFGGIIPFILYVVAKLRKTFSSART
ncbi:GerAB/ArcD/ProY family transporter [Halalkalibacterium halodurans]|uniref:GerAB/ArcD/ProY family transporter n=1 Tax=Halalkalibacterium halodurans TaxID=86665 RepID=UPI00141A2C53|nr:GerAB/ArcD/ProY family transporter [Halalkalibacterium halodurans]